MSLDWLKLRAWDGSLQTGFEKLCVQLLSREPLAGNSVFVPKSAPDAGVEALWRFESGSEWGIQAKFFLGPLTTTQWQQLDESVERALERHSKLQRYTIAIPQDQADPRIPGERWFADKWNARVLQWTEWAKKRAMSVVFDYWGETELLNRLTKNENRGLMLFWFDKDLLTTDWMLQRVRETVRNVGPRYTPEVHVDLPIAFSLEGLGRTGLFYERIKHLKIDLEKKLRRATIGPATEKVSANWADLKAAVGAVTNSILTRLEPSNSIASFSTIQQYAQTARDAVWSCIESIERFEAEKAEANKPRQPGQSMFEYEIRSLQDLAEALGDVGEFARSEVATAADIGSLLIVGGAGTGKTHLLCDIALRRLRGGLPTLLLVGTQFENAEPLAQVPTRILGLQMNRDDFLAGLDAAGDIAGARSLIFIDGINEKADCYGRSSCLECWKHLVDIGTLGSRYLCGIAMKIWLFRKALTNAYCRVFCTTDLRDTNTLQPQHTSTTMA